MSSAFGVSQSFMCREIIHIIPILFAKIRLIHLFDEEYLILFPQLLSIFFIYKFSLHYLISLGTTQEDHVFVHGVIDCTVHRRDRVHPGQNFFYRGDKKYHFFGSQAVVSLSGHFTRVLATTTTRYVFFFVFVLVANKFSGRIEENSRIC